MEKQKTKPARESAGLRFLYHTVSGRAILRLLSARWVSRGCGAFLDSPLSKPMIGRFFRKNGIDRADYLPEKYRCFNDCFCRHIRPELRPIDRTPEHLIAPCDGLLSVYRATDDTVLPVKQSLYRLPALLGSAERAARYRDGWVFVFRLCVNHYHRYCYAEEGDKGTTCFIRGRLHTVRPIALEQVPVFTENCRACTEIVTERFGTLTQIEVGAMLVGRICNLHSGECHVLRGEEKGCFQYGGSTIMLLVERDAIAAPEALLDATANGVETPVRIGEAVAIGDKGGIKG